MKTTHGANADGRSGRNILWPAHGYVVLIDAARRAYPTIHPLPPR